MIYFIIFLPYLVIYLTKYDIAAYVAIVLSGIATLTLMYSMVTGTTNTLLNSTTLLVGFPMIVLAVGSIMDYLFVALGMKEFRINVLLVLQYVAIGALIGIICNIIYVVMQ